MNIDYGLFHLLTALGSMRNGNSFAQTQEAPSAVEPKLPDIDHSLLSRTILHQDRPPIRANRCCEIAAADLAHETINKTSLRQRTAAGDVFVATCAVIGTGVGFSLSGMTSLRTLPPSYR